MFRFGIAWVSFFVVCKVSILLKQKFGTLLWNWNEVCALKILAQFSDGAKTSKEIKLKVNLALERGKEVALCRWSREQLFRKKIAIESFFLSFSAATLTSVQLYNNFVPVNFADLSKDYFQNLLRTTASGHNFSFTKPLSPSPCKKSSQKKIL